jgi:hypothetical protein
MLEMAISSPVLLTQVRIYLHRAQFRNRLLLSFSISSDLAVYFGIRSKMGLPATFVKGFHNEENVRKMEYRQLGRTNLMISKLSIGGGALAEYYGFDLSMKTIPDITYLLLFNWIASQKWQIIV